MFISSLTRIGDYPSRLLTLIRLCHTANPKLEVAVDEGEHPYFMENSDVTYQSFFKTDN